MTSRQTVIAFGIYLFLTGLTLIFAPGLLAKMLFLPLPSGPYYLVLGLVVIVLAYYYVRLGREGSQAFVQATVVARLGFAFAVGLGVMLGALPLGLLIVAVVDVAAAAWTGAMLKREGFKAIVF